MKKIVTLIFACNVFIAPIVHGRVGKGLENFFTTGDIGGGKEEGGEYLALQKEEADAKKRQEEQFGADNETEATATTAQTGENKTDEGYDEKTDDGTGDLTADGSDNGDGERDDNFDVAGGDASLGGDASFGNLEKTSGSSGDMNYNGGPDNEN